MARPLPPYETLVRWSVRDVTEWLKEANLTDFKDQFTKQNIDGQRLVNLTDVDVNSFIGKPKKKHTLNQYISQIKKPSLTSNKPAWIPSQPRKTSRQEQEKEEEDIYEDDGDNDSIYSWGDDFDEDDDDNDSDQDNYIDPVIDDYVDPLPPQPAPSVPDRRSPMKPPIEDSMPNKNVPLLPGQCPVEPSSRGNRKQSRTLQKPPFQENVPKAKKSGRRPVPAPPQFQDELYINETDLGKSPSGHEEKDSYIKFGGQRTDEDFYVEPEEEIPEAPSLPPARVQKSIQPTTSPSDLLGRSLPPTPGRRGSTPKETLVRSLPPTPGRKTSIPKGPPEPPKVEDELEALYSYSWYHSNVDRAEAERRLREENHNGMFLVRRSLKGGLAHPYTLMVFYQNRTYNFPVRRQPSDGKFALGKENPNKKNELVFSTVEELISNFKSVPLILNPQSKTASKTKLTKALTKI